MSNLKKILTNKIFANYLVYETSWKVSTGIQKNQIKKQGFY